MRYNKIFVDFDETIAESILAITEIMNKKNGTYIRPQQVKSWDFLDVYPSLNKHELEQMFESEEFFSILKCKPYAKEVLSELSKEYEIELVTVASDKAIGLKRKFIEENFPFIRNIYQIKFGESKSLVDMSGGIFFDDVTKNLYDSNALEKVMIVNNPGSEWNVGWSGEKINSWTEAYKFFVEG